MDLKRASPLEGFPLLAKFHAALRALPALQEYFDGPLYKLPVNNPQAAFF